jgi:RND family efflux transporter MFP subunit
MSILKPIALLAAGCSIMLGAATLAQNVGSPSRAAASSTEPLVLAELKNVDWIEKSDLVAQQKGVIEHMELKLGMYVKKGGIIGYLHRELAGLDVKKKGLQAEQKGPTEKAKAQKEVAVSKVARDKRLNERKAGMVSAEDVAKDEGELKVAEAQLVEATENTAIAKAELELAEETLRQHTIRAPFDGVVIERKRNPGESVQAGEVVVVLGNPTRLCVEPYVPLEYAFRVKVGQVVEIQPRISPKGAPLSPIERKHFRGKITFVHPEVQSVAEEGGGGVRVRAEFDNSDFELRPGLMVQVTIFVTPDVSTGSSQAADATRTARTD